MATIHLPDGTRVRTDTRRRFLLIGQAVRGRAWIEARSDDRARLEATAERCLSLDDRVVFYLVDPDQDRVVQVFPSPVREEVAV